MDALRDLDDPLTMTHLFATLPAESTHDIPAKVVANARRLSMEFQAYVVRAHALRKVFVSVKGFYYQADIQGQAVTWLVPHNLAQVCNYHLLHLISVFCMALRSQSVFGSSLNVTSVSFCPGHLSSVSQPSSQSLYLYRVVIIIPCISLLFAQLFAARLFSSCI